MSLLAHVLGAPEPPHLDIRRNRTYHADADGTVAVTKTEPSADEIALLQSLNVLDSAVHAHARQLLERRCAAVRAAEANPPPRRLRWTWRRFWAG